LAASEFALDIQSPAVSTLEKKDPSRSLPAQNGNL